MVAESLEGIEMNGYGGAVPADSPLTPESEAQNDLMVAEVAEERRSLCGSTVAIN